MHARLAWLADSIGWAAPDRDPSDAAQRQLVAMLYVQTTTLAVGGLALAIVAGLCSLRTHEAWFAVWAGLILLALAGRLMLERSFRRRAAPLDGSLRTTLRWRDRFIAGAWVMGGLWGVAALTVCRGEEPLVQMFVISVETVIIMGAAARNASCPPAARGQTLLGLGPLTIACLASPDPYYKVFSLFLVFAFFAAQTLVTHLYLQHVRFLNINEANADLIREVGAANRELAAVNGRLEHAAATDALTGIANRRRFDTVLAGEMRRAVRAGRPLALLLLDIDSFKGFNDEYGHQAGDACLQRVAAALSAALRRPGDLAARYGGEEFAAILPETEAAAALEHAEAVRRAVEALAVPTTASPLGIVSVSIGLANFDPARHLRPEDLIRCADEALYVAKGAGRNCVRVPLARYACGASGAIGWSAKISSARTIAE